MESPILKQIAEFLQTRKQQKQWMVVFVLLAVLVGFGTVTGLKMMGQAMTRKEKVLDCQLKLHEHTKNCYDQNNNVICGYADYAVHKHNDDCYNSDKKLVCRLPEVEKHEHTKKCYEKTETLVCGQEESDGHQHGDDCYTTQQGGLACGMEEHSHSDDCYDEEGNLVCGMDEHEHNDDCYQYEDVLTCKVKEGEGGHKHTDKCYDVQETLTCGELEMHTHTDKCFEKIDKDGKDEPENLRLICGQTELIEHTHTEEAGCLRTVDAAEADVIQEKLDEEAKEDDASEEGKEVFTTDLNEDEEAAEGEDAEGEAAEGEDAEAAEGEEAKGDDVQAAEGEAEEGETAEPETYEETKTYEGLGYIVTASYNKDANIPEEAKFIAEQITKEGNEEDYKKHEEEYKKSVGNEDATMSALFKLGFYVDGEEVEPASPVMITVQFVDKNGLPEGKPVKVVHFGDEKTEVIKGSKAESGSTSFKTDGFSLFGFGPDEEEEVNEADTEKVSVHISESAKYEDDVFSATFHISGNIEVSPEIAAAMQNGNGKEDGQESEGTASGEDAKEEGDAEGSGDSGDAEENGSAESEEGEETEEGESGEETDTSQESPSGSDEEGERTDETASGSDESSNEQLKFEVKTLGEDTDKYKAVLSHIEQSDEKDEMLRLQMVFCSLSCSGEEIDISGCKVTTEITTAPSLNEQAQLSIPEAVKQVLGEDKVAEIGEEKIEKKTGITIKAMKVNGVQIDDIGDTYLTQNEAYDPIENEAVAHVEAVAMAASANEDIQCTVQYYAYAQTMARTNPGDGAEAISIINTCTEAGVKDKAQLPVNSSAPAMMDMYVKPTKDTANNPNGKSWPIYKPAYEEEISEASMTKLYTANQYEFREIANGLDNINKFAKDGLHFELYEVWVLQDPNKKDGLNNTGWNVYKEVSKLSFTNNKEEWEKIKDTDKGKNVILIEDDTVIRLVGKSKTDSKNYPVNFFDYDITNGTSNYWLKGINDPANYVKSGNAVIEPRYGFGNSGANKKKYDNNGNESTNGNRSTGLENDQLNGYNINQAVQVPDYYKIPRKCSFGLVENALGADGYPDIKANAPNLFAKGEVTGREYIPNYMLGFGRNGDTYTLESVVNSKSDFAKDLNLFQKGALSWADPNKVPDEKRGQIWTNQFWPMDNTSTHGTSGHDPKHGTKTTYQKTGLAEADDGREHNCYFGMSFDVEFELTDDYVGPLNYYFFGDDDMWVYLEYPDGSTRLVCDIGGVHQAAGEYVDLWNYIQRPEDGDVVTRPNDQTRPTQTYRLKFFYTERGASGSTCWMQFTLPSVNAVPVIDYTGNVKSTLTFNKTVEGEIPDRRFDFQIKFEKVNSHVDINKYPYQITRSDGTIEKGDINSGGTFKLGHNDTIEVFNLPDDTKYTITETNHDGYKPELGNGSSGQITKNETVEGNIDWKLDDKVDYINQTVEYELPETGGSGLMIYTIAGALCILLGAGFMYTKKARERRV